MAVVLLFLPWQVILAQIPVGGKLTLSPNTSAWLWDVLRSCMPESDEAPSSVDVISLPPSGSDYVRGIRAAAAGDVDQAQVLLARAYRRSGHVPALILLMNLSLEPASTAEDAARQIERLSLSNSKATRVVAEFYLSQAGRCLSNGHFAEAQRYRDLGLGLLPPGAEAMLSPQLSRRVAEIFYYEGRKDEALPWLRRAAPAGGSPLLQLAEILHNKGRYEEAVPIYRKALKDYPTRVDTRLAAARAAESAGQLEEARRFLEGMQPLEQLGIEGLLQLARVCSQLGDVACAQAQYERILSLDPANQQATEELRRLP